MARLLCRNVKKRGDDDDDDDVFVMIILFSFSPFHPYKLITHSSFIQKAEQEGLLLRQGETERKNTIILSGGEEKKK